MEMNVLLHRMLIEFDIERKPLYCVALVITNGIPTTTTSIIIITSTSTGVGMTV